MSDRRVRIEGEDDVAKLEPTLRKLACMLTRDPDAQEDLVSAGLLAALEALPRYRPGSMSAASYLVRRAKWRMQDWLRAEKKARLPTYLRDGSAANIPAPRERYRRLVVYVAESDVRAIEEITRNLRGKATRQDVIRAAIRLLATLREAMDDNPE